MQAMWGAAGEVKALRSVIKRVAASELEIAAEEAAEAATYWEDMVRRRLPSSGMAVRASSRRHPSQIGRALTD